MPAPDGAPCEDGDVCTVDDVCLDGQCVGREMPWDDGDACAYDAPNPTGRFEP